MGQDTIAAIATALSDAGIGIVRISGENALETGDAVFRSKGGRKRLQDAESHTVHYGYIAEVSDGSKGWEEIIDEVMVSVFRAPRSYTMEDTVEISCHGGVLVTRRVLETVLRAGARMAEPGEFTKRAFLNGRIDLSEAEAVMDLIHSRNEYALSASVSQLKGNLFREIKELRGDIIYEIAFIESALDDPENISLEGYPERLYDKTKILTDRIAKLVATAEDGRLIKEGISTVIVGKPNAGKSSLLNLLVGEDRAIVTEIAGTTRDILEEHINFQGIGLNVIDTAGIRDTQDRVEKIGVDRAKKYARNADLILYVVDSSCPLDHDDREILSLVGDKNMIVLLNKSDLESAVSEKDLRKWVDETLPERGKIEVVRTSTRDSSGIGLFEDVIRKMFFEGRIRSNSEIVITNMRHKEALQNAFDSLQLVRRSIEDGMEEDFYSIDLMSAYSELGRIIGEEVEDDLVEEIFSKFCMGK